MLEPANLVAAYLLAPDATIIVQPPENLGAGTSRQSPPRDASRPIPPDEQFGAAVLTSGTRRCCVRSEQNLTHLHQVLKLKNLVGENGSGKSPLLEAIAQKCGFNLRGGNKN